MKRADLDDLLFFHAKEQDKVDCLIIDCADLGYISSAGLRILLMIKKSLKENEFVLHNVNESVIDILDITGFSNLFTVVFE